MLEGISHLKRGNHSSVMSTRTFLYDIREPRYEEVKIGYQISNFLDIADFTPFLLFFGFLLLSKNTSHMKFVSAVFIRQE